MRNIVFSTTVTDITAQTLELKPSEFGLLMYLKLQETQGGPAPTRAELLERLPIKERTLDGALAVLKARGLITSAIVYRVTDSARAI